MNRKKRIRALAVFLMLSIVGVNVQLVRADEEDDTLAKEQVTKEIKNMENARAQNALSKESSAHIEEWKNTESAFADKQAKNTEKNDIDVSTINDNHKVKEEVEDTEESDPEKYDRANSWRYKDGERIPSRVKYQQYTTWPTGISGTIANGIDVSEHQGVIDWQKVKGAGVDYAIVRCGYGQNQTDQDDDYWFINADACEKYGIPFGTYLYSYADSVEKAKSEAQHVLRLVAGYNMEYPIYYDLEESSIRSKLSETQVADIAEAFCDTIEAAGYEVAVYANTDWFSNYLTDSRFDQWDKWVAQYNTTCTYEGRYSMWQCSSQGSVAGISGYTDLNIELEKVSVSGKRIVTADGKLYGYDGDVQLYGAQKIGDYWFYFDSSKGGAAHIGWRIDNGNTYYYDEEGRLVQGAKKIGSYWYYFSGNGNMYIGWRKDGSKTYYYDEEGRLAQKATVIDGKWYYFSSNGELQ